MSKLWVPPKVSRELEDSTARFNAEAKDQFRFNESVCQTWNPELQKIDPYLRLARAKEHAHFPGVLPNYYHMVRLNPVGPIWFQPLTGPNMSFVEPTLRMLDTLRGSDLQNPRAVRDRKMQQDMAEKARKTREERETEERQEEMLERWRSATQTRVSMTDARPWTQNVSGRVA